MTLDLFFGVWLAAQVLAILAFLTLAYRNPR